MIKKTGIGFRIIAMAVSLSVIAAVIGVIGLYTTRTVSGLGTTMYRKNLLRVQYANDIQKALQSAAVTLINANITGRTAKEIDAFKKEFSDERELFAVSLTKLESTNIQSEEKKALLKEIKESGQEYGEEGGVMFDYFEKGDLVGATNYMKKVLAPIRTTRLGPAIEKLLNIETVSAKKSYDTSLHISSLSLTFIVTAILVGLAISLLLGITITRSITKPVSKIVSNLSDSSGQISISSTQLSASSQEIANGAQEQAASIEETTSSMEELSSMVKQNLGSTRQASLLAEKATEASQNGFDKMSEMLVAMNGISKSTEDIKNVISVIDDISFQTNMLALNAAVEAARAGEAGMGFAVVADEVKNLANRSSESAKETAAMIKDTLKNVEAGMTLSKNLSEIFKDILTNSKKVMEMNREVETASGQQDEGISQVNKALIQLDTVVQTNASSAEETASAAEELQGQVSNLDEIVNTLYTIVTGTEYSSDQDAFSVHSSQILKKMKKVVPVTDRGPRSDGRRETTAKSPLRSKTDIQEAPVAGKNTSNEKTDQQKTPVKKDSGEKKEHAISFEDDEEFKAT